MALLQTSRLVLRAPTADDAELILELLNDPDWIRYIGDRGVRTVEDARGYIDLLLRRRAEAGSGLDVVELRGDRTAIGICGLVRRDWLGHPDLGFAFLPRFRGHGHASEAARATLDDAFARLGERRLLAVVSPENGASIRLLEGLGFELERGVRPPGEENEVLLYSRHHEAVV